MSMWSAPIQTRFNAICLGVLLVSSVACFAAKQPPGPVWPPPPADPCVTFLRSISRPADIGAKTATGSRIAGWLTGSQQDKQELSRPFGLALDEAGNLLVTDTGANAVFMLDTAHKKWRRWDSADKLKFECPVAMAAQNETIFVADSGLGKVVGFTQKGKLLFQVGDPLQRPTGIALADSKMFITDSQLHQVIVCDLLGHVLSRFGQRGAGPGEFNFPTHISVDTKGNLYVTDALNYRVQVFDQQGRFLRAVGSAGDAPGRFSRPKGAAADSYGHLYIIDSLFDNVQVFDAAGRLLLNWGEAGSAPGEFWLPNGIVINGHNEIYVADTYNHRIQVFQFIGKE
jgi:sugar lactone lactonase YvrE